MFRLVGGARGAGHTCVVYLDDRHGWDIEQHRRNDPRLAARRPRRGPRRRAPASRTPTRSSPPAGRPPTRCSPRRAQRRALLLRRRTSSRRSTRPAARPCWPRRPTASASTASPHGRWLAQMLRRDYGMHADHFDFGCDLETYALDRSPGADEPAHGHLLLLPPLDAAPRARAGHRRARPLRRPPPRGGHPLLRRAGRQAAVRGDRPRPANPEQLNELYNRCVAGLVLSATNVSLVPHEMLAAAASRSSTTPSTPASCSTTTTSRTRRPRLSSSPTRSTRSSRPARPSASRPPRASVTGATWADAGAEFERIVRRIVEQRCAQETRGVSPQVSVIVPCYRYADVLEGCVSSILEQEGVDVRVLILDDCSPDDTPAVGVAPGRRRPARGVPAQRSRTSASSATANAGLAWADGDYVVLISADDVLVPAPWRAPPPSWRPTRRSGMVYGHAPYWHVGGPPPVLKGRWQRDRRSGAAPTGCACAAGRATTASPRPRSSCAPRCSARSAAMTRSARTPATSTCGCASRPSPTSPASAASRRPSTGSTPRACCAARTRPIVDLRERTHGLRLASSPRRSAARERRRAARDGRPRAGPPGSVAGQPRLRPRPHRGPGRAARRRADRLRARGLSRTPARLREWRGLQVRRRIGAGRSMLFLPFVATGAAHRVRGHVTASCAGALAGSSRRSTRPSGAAGDAALRRRSRRRTAPTASLRGSEQAAGGAWATPWRVRGSRGTLVGFVGHMPTKATSVGCAGALAAPLGRECRVVEPQAQEVDTRVGDERRRATTTSLAPRPPLARFPSVRQ